MPGDETASPKPLLPAELTIDAVFDAYFDCRRHKRNTLNQLAFEADLESNLVALWRDLAAGTYRIGRSLAFVVTYPKIREIWAADFRDRVVHHVIYNAIRDRFLRRFIRDSYACIPGRGNHDGLARVSAMARSATQGWSRPASYLKIDIANFFSSIDRLILLELVLARVPEPWLRQLVSQVILHDPRPGAVYKSTPAQFARVPVHKSLRRAAPGIGLPIGNLTSQFFANIYLDTLDQFAKRTLNVRYYGRYVDDMVLLHEDPGQLHAWCLAVDEFLQNTLHLRLHPKKIQLNRLDHGLNFIGFIVKPGRTYLRRSTLANCHKRVRGWVHAGRPVDPAALAGVTQSVNSYLGMLRAVDGYNERRRICESFDTLFAHPDDAFTKIITAR